MKKIIYILVFAIILTSCNNEGTKRQDGSWLISSIDVNEKITGLMGMYYNVIDANIIAIPQGFLKPKKYLVEVTFEKNSMGRQTKSTKRIAGKAVQHTENQ